MEPSLKEKLTYRLERYLNKGGSSIFTSLFIVFVFAFILIIAIRWVILFFWPDLGYTDSFLDDIWLTWLQMTDPGNMNQDNLSPTWLKITTILSGVVGVIILSMLIAFITTALEKVFYDFRKGRGKIIEQDFTLILGWNERVVDIIRELILANESEKSGAVVILSNEDKEKMDDLISKRIPDTLTTRITTTTGDYANINELKRVNTSRAKSVIVLARCSESDPEEKILNSDIQSIKAIMAIGACQPDGNEIPIIAEIFNSDKREIVEFFEDENIIALDSWEIMGKLLVQTSLTSGLEMVYNEILSFDGCEVYFYHAEWNNIEFGELPNHFKDGIPLGVYSKEKGILLNPGKNYKLEEYEQIIILAEDDSTIHFNSSPHFSPSPISLVSKKQEPQQKTILILGWHSIAEIFINESADYLKEGSSFRIIFNKPTKELLQKVDEMKSLYPQFNIELENNNPLHFETLQDSTPFNYDNIIILSQQMSHSGADKIDSDTLIILLLLRKIKSKLGEVHTKIITQVLNSDNQDIITQTEVDDFIISNKLITMILAQLSEEPLIMQFYNDIFSEDGSEIYVKESKLYLDKFPVKISFGNLIELAQQRGEICLGIRKGKDSKNAKTNFGITLNLDKHETVTLEAEDYLVVLSEDEL